MFYIIFLRSLAHSAFLLSPDPVEPAKLKFHCDLRIFEERYEARTKSIVAEQC